MVDPLVQPSSESDSNSSGMNSTHLSKERGAS
jgi:hypothetical protein